MKRILIILSLLMPFFVNAQNLTITSSGQTGTSGTNWSASGSNPVTLSFSNTANVNSSVIEGYLNAGISVIIQPSNTTNADVVFEVGINKSNGNDATLTIKSNRRIFTPTINSTSGKLNLVVIVEADGGSSAGPAIGPTNTNGGHIWVGGGNGTAIWNGLTVGNGPAHSDGTLNGNPVDLMGNLTTNGGDVLFSVDDNSNNSSFGDLAAWNGSRTINAGSGDIVLLSELADFTSNQGNTITLNTTGTLTLAPPNSANRWPGSFSWQGDMSGTTFTGTNSNASGLIINNYTSLGGLSIGTYTGTGTPGDTNYQPVSNTELSDIFINSAISTVGPITVYGLSAYINAPLTTTNSTAGDIQFKMGADIIQGVGDHITTSGADVVYWADYDANGGRVEILSNINTSGGNIWIGGAAATETQNGLTVPTGYAESVSIDKQGVLISGSTINSGGGQIRIKGLSDDTGNGGQDIGVKIFNVTLQSGAGNLSIFGTVNNDLSTGAGLWIGTDIHNSGATGNVNINSTSGNIYLEGIAAANNSYTWGHGFMLLANGGDDISITSTTGNISLNGDAITSANFSGEAVGFVTQINNSGSFVNINTDGGTVLIKGKSDDTDDDFGASFRAQNVANNIAIGDTNTGNITLQFGSLSTNTQSTLGVVSFNSVGGYVVEPIGTSFASIVDLTDEYSFATNATGFRFGKVGNTANLRLNTDISVKGPIAIYGGSFEAVQLFSNITSTANGDILIQGNSPESNGWTARLASGKSISKTAGTGNIYINGPGRILFEGSITASGTAKPNIVIVAETDNGGTYGVGASNITTNGGHVWIGGGSLTHTWNGLTVGSKWANGGGGGNVNAIDLLGNITTSGGDVFMAGWAATAVDIVANGGSRTINTGTGNITLSSRSSRFANGTNYINLASTGIISLAPLSGNTYNLSDLTVTGTTSNGNFTGTDDLSGLVINGISSVKGLVFGNYLGTGVSGDTPYAYANTSITTISTAFNINAFIQVYGSGININSALTSAATGAAIQVIATAGDANLNANLTTSTSGASILTKATGAINLSASRTIQSSGGDVTLNATSGGTATTAQSAIYLNGSSQILSNGGNITLGGGCSGTEGNLYAATNISGVGYAVRMDAATVLNAAGGNINVYGSKILSYGDGIYLNSVNISTTGSGTIGIYGDAHGGFNGTTYFGGITFENLASTIQTVDGNLTLKGILTNSQSSQGYGINFYRSAGSAGQTRHIQLLSRKGAIQIIGDSGNSIGGGIGHSSWGNVYFGSPSDASYTATGDVTISYSKLVGAGLNGFKVKTTGAVSYLPTGTSFADAQTMPYNSNYVVAESASSLTIGKATNTADITFAAAATVAGPITAYGGTVTASANMTSTATTGTGISLNGQKIIQAVGVSANTSGANIDYLAANFPTTSVGDNAIRIGDISGGRSSINAGGGNITLTGSYGTTSAAGGTDFALWVFSTDIVTSGSGLITLNGDATNTLTTSSAYGISLGNTTIKTASGAISLNGTGGKASNNARGIVADQFSNKIISTSGDITLKDIKPVGLTGTYNGFFLMPSSAAKTFIGADGTDIISSSSPVTIQADKLNFSANGTFINELKTSGSVVLESIGNTFEVEATLTGLSIAGLSSQLRIGKTTNNTNLTFGRTITTAGPILAYGANLNINENLNTTAGTTNGDILLKASGDISLAASKTITTAGGDVILWANSDNAATNGSISLRNASSITTGSNTVAGGNVWLGGGNDGATWNGLAVGSGYAVPGTSFTPSNGGSIISGGIYLEGSSINSFGGHVKLAGDASTSNYGLLTYATNSIDAKSGKIELDGNASNSSSASATGVLFGMHDVSIASIMNLTSSASDLAIKISGIGRGTGDALALSGTLNVLSTGAGDISINGNAIGTGRSIVAGNYYSGILNAFANSGKISLNGGTKAVQVATQQFAGKTAGPSKINIGQGGSIANSSSDVFITADNIAIAGAGIAVNSSGKITIEPSSNSFASALTFPITNLSLANTVSGLTLGKPTNTTNITFGGPTTIAGPITVYGGELNINENLNTTAGTTNGDILLKATANIVLASTKSITTSGGDVILWSNSDGETSNGGVFFDAQASVNTNGGHIWVGGSATNNGSSVWNGLTVGDGYAVSGRSLFGFSTRTSFKIDWDAGVLLNETSLNSGGGNIYIAGQRNVRGNYSGGSGIINYNGLNGTTINAGTGLIHLKGDGKYSGDVTFGMMTGLHPGETPGNFTVQSSNATGANAILIEATNANNNFSGLLIEDDTRIISSAASNGGKISIQTSTAGNFFGTWIQVGSLNVLSASGSIALDAGAKGLGLHVNTSFNNSSGQLISNTGALFLGSKAGSAVTSSTAHIDVISDRFETNTGSSINIASSGNLTIQPKSSIFSQPFTTAQWTIGNGLSALTIGKTTNTSNVTINSATTTSGPITAYGGTLAINGALTATNNNITLGASTAITQTQPIVANGLALTGAGTVTLNNASNNITTLAGGTTTSKIGSLNFTDASGGLTIGTINSTGAVKIETLVGDVILSENIQTDNTTEDAIFINAGKNAVIGTSTGGDIKVSGTPTLTMGTGGIAKLFSGSGLASTGLTTLVGGVANVRYSVDETTATFSPVLAANGKYALYRAAVSTNANLSALSISSGTLSPNFASGTTSYTVSVSNVISSITVTPTVTDIASTIQVKVNSGSFGTVISGNASSGLSLNDGDNLITVRVTAQDGTTVKDYTITVTKAATLPVMLVTYEAKLTKEGTVQLSWLTASELNNSYFEILKSTDGVNFTSLGKLNGFGNSSQENKYGFIDGYPSLGTNYYMLVQYDIDGTRKELGLRSVKVSLKAKEIQIYPNPTKGLININLAGSSSYEKLELIDLTGKILLSKSISKEESIISFDMSNLASGIYQIRLSGEGKLLSKQIIKQ